MEVLHDLRPGCGTVVRRPLALLLTLVAGCGGGDRQGLTADSAVMQPVEREPDSLRTDVEVPFEPGFTDSLRMDGVVVANPGFVLIADSIAGDVLFRRKGKCLSCHGLAGMGIAALGPDLRDSVWLHGDGSFAFIQRTIMDGIARPKVASIGMPAFERAANVSASALSTTLSAEEIYHISAYVYTLSHAGRAVTDTARAIVDTLTAGRDTLVPPVPPPHTTPASASGGAVLPTLTGR